MASGSLENMSSGFFVGADPPSDVTVESLQTRTMDLAMATMYALYASQKLQVLTHSHTLEDFGGLHSRVKGQCWTFQ